jgi:hypothetical protein
MLAAMPRPTSLVHGAIVLSIAFTAVACAGRSLVPPPAVRYPAPAPVRSVGPGDHYVEALVAKLATDPLILHSDQTTKGTASYESEQANLSAELNTTVTMDLSGRDHAMHMVSKTPAGKTAKTDLVVVGKTVYSRVDKGKWMKSSRVDYERSRTDVARAYRLVRNPAYLRYVGLETVDKQKLHHITAIRDLPYISMTGMAGTFTMLDFWVEDDGTPVLIKGTFTTVVDYGIEITGTSEMRISKFGGPIKIVAPKN